MGGRCMVGRWRMGGRCMVGGGGWWMLGGSMEDGLWMEDV